MDAFALQKNSLRKEWPSERVMEEYDMPRLPAIKLDIGKVKFRRFLNYIKLM